jgi:hypothetical protein
MSLIVTQNQIGYVDPATSALDTGWTISSIYAVHQSCNSGFIKSITSLGLIVGHQYTITYTVSDYISGGVKVVCGADNGVNRTANGTYTETLTCTTIPQLSFFSDGALKISLLSFYDVEDGSSSGTTITFNEGANQWGSDQPFHPEFMIKFLDQFLTVKNGQVWLHDSNPVRGNFYGQDNPAEVIFIVNKDYKIDKLFYNLRINGKGKWYAPDITIPSTNQFPNGMLSRLKKNNVQQIDGKLWAEILKDITDPNFATSTELDSLFNGRMLQGPWMILHLKCDDTGAVDLSAIDTYFDYVNRTM